MNRFIISYIISGNEDTTYEGCLGVTTEHHAHSGATTGEADDLSARLLGYWRPVMRKMNYKALESSGGAISDDELNGCLNFGELCNG